MAALTTQRITQTGLARSLQAASVGGDSWTPTATTFLEIANGSGSSITATIAVTATAFGQPVQNVAVVVAAGAEVLIGPFPPAEVAGATGQGTVTYSAVTSVTVGVLSL